MEGLRIGTVAERAGITVETVRFYEHQGLIPRPPRRSSGYRVYPSEVIRRLRFIRRAKELGFTLKEVAELLALRFEGDSDCGQARAHTEAKLRDVEERIATLERMREALRDLLHSCHRRVRSGPCPILSAIDDEEPGA